MESVIDLVIATRNNEKKREISRLLRVAGVKVTLRTLNDFSPIPEVKEDGRTFAENAAKKALAAARYTGTLALADDSGLEVYALGGKPGVRSSRFAGKGADDGKNNSRLLRLLKNIPLSRRHARFVCAMALADKSGLAGIVEGECKGSIASSCRGSAGFGYDPLFVVPGYHKTFAELGAEVKDRISHRARAVKKVCRLLRSYAKKHRGGPRNREAAGKPRSPC